MVEIPKLLEFCCRFFGIIQFDTSKNAKKNRTQNILSICYPLPIVALYVYGIYGSMQSDKKLKYSYVLVLFSNWANYIVKYVWYLIKRNSIKDLLNDLDEYDYNSSKLLGNVMKEGKERTFLLIILLLYVTGIYYISGDGVAHSRDVLNYFIPTASNIFERLFHSVLLTSIVPKFKVINKKFKKYILTIEMEKAYKNNNKLEQIDSMEHLSILHCTLSRNVMNANELLTLPFLLTFSSYLALLINSTYDLVFYFNRGIMYPLFLWNYVNLTGFTILNLVMEIKIWNSTALVANKTSTYIHSIWNTYAKNKLVDVDVNHLKLISTRLLNTKLNLTALGFFPIDWALLHMVTATLTTYLIILNQLGL